MSASELTTSGEFQTFVNTYVEEDKLLPSDPSIPVATPQEIYDVLESGSKLMFHKLNITRWGLGKLVEQ